MIVAGVGCRKGVEAHEVRAALDAALAEYGLSPASLSALATAEFKHAEEAITATGQALRVPVLLVDRAALRAVSFRALTSSGHSLAVSGSPSVSETTALAAAGQRSQLLGPRVVVGRVTCAIAANGDCK